MGAGPTICPKCYDDMRYISTPTGFYFKCEDPECGYEDREWVKDNEQVEGGSKGAAKEG